MMQQSTVWRLWLGLGLLSCSISIHSHQLKEAISVVSFNQHTKQIEVAHRIYVHDAEVILNLDAERPHNFLEDPKAQQAFAQYVVRHFAMSVDDQALTLTLLGHEVEGQHFWVYQEHPMADTPEEVTISYTAMMEFWPDQRNVINIEGLGSLKTIHLSQANHQQVVVIE